MRTYFQHLFSLTILALVVWGCQLKPLPPGSLLFQDDFSDPSSGWLTGVDNSGTVGYVLGWFRFHINTNSSTKVSVPGLHFTDIHLEVDAIKIGGSDDNHYGVVCRYQDQGNFYFYEISSDGYYATGKFINGQMSLIGMTQMQSSDLILQGENTNRLRADCIGDTLTFYVNDKLIATLKDTNFKDGDVGLIAGTLESPGSDILFDNFIVRNP